MTETTNKDPWKEANARYDRIRKAEAAYFARQEEEQREQEYHGHLKRHGLLNSQSGENSLETHC